MGSSLFAVSFSHGIQQTEISADLVVVEFLNGVERINLELVDGVITIIGQELILDCQSGTP